MKYDDRRSVDIPAKGWPRVRMLIGRALRLHCPLCGGGGIWRGWLTIKDACPHCRTRFAREHGYFQGAMAVNLAVAELVTVGTIVALFVFTVFSWIWMELIVLPIAIGLPLLFWPFARTLWLALDLVLSPDRADDRRVGG
ncbi:MAG: DUF983 domain-containing protein [Thermomicrobiales bacterium]